MVIQKMADLGFVTQEEADDALMTPVQLAPYSPYTQVQEPYVVAFVRKQLIDMFGEEKVFQGGLQVETTINPAYQKLATDAITSTLNQPADPSAALVSIESDTGYIRAMVGGTDYSTSTVQPRLAGPAPGRLGLQDLRADGGDRDGHRPLRTLPTCPCRSR